LWHTGASCTSIPNGWYFSLYTADGTIIENNFSISHPWGANISISSDSAPCNGETWDRAEYLLFNTSYNSGDEFRTRYSSYIGSIWRADNKYRYFIR
jgi:hypothetical protein